MTFDNGNPCELSQFSSEKAVQLMMYLSGGYNAFAVLTECRSTEAMDIVCFTVQPELSQLTKEDIRRSEPIAVHFDKQDKILPVVYAMREDFPRQIPHLNLELEGWPANLCLYSEAYRDLKPFWTAARFVERIREWLKETANGTLHEKDQPLEPLFFGYGQNIILPQELYNAADEEISIKRILLIESGEALNAIQMDKLPEGYKSKNGKYPPTAFCVRLPPQEHGSISHTPLRLQDVGQFMAKAGYNIFEQLYQSIKSGASTIDDTVLNSSFCIIGWFPKTRNAAALPETTDVWVFFATKTVAEVLTDIGAYDSVGRTYSLRIGGRDANRNGENTEVIILNPTFMLSADLAAIFNGHEEASPQKILAVGAGAIGSNIVLNSVRAGFGKWVLVDDDIILPHNLARHALDGTYLGYPKAEAVKIAANASMSKEPVLEALKADFIQPKNDNSDKITGHLADSEIILDLSASVSVARYLSHDANSKARRISMFLTPSGKDLVILAEDKERRARLDMLEMLYYREIMQNSDLKDHLTTSSKTRYANSCRDLSSRISQDHVALHGAIGSRNLRKIASDDAAYIKIYRADDDMRTSSIVIPVEEFSSIKVAKWEVFISESALQSLFSARSGKLPKETGGILIGFFNMQYHTLYIVDIVGEIADSIEYPDAFIRGHGGLPEKIKAVQDRTAGNLTYVGEWHSHPDRSKCWPSNDDKKVIGWINDHMAAEGVPPVMLIVGDKAQLCVCIENGAKILEWKNAGEEFPVAV